MDLDKTHQQSQNLKESALRKCPKCEAIYSGIAFCPNDGTQLEIHQGDEGQGALFAEKYQILEELGQGGMGTVYRVKQVLLDRFLALKVIPSHSFNEQLAVRFQREAKTMASLDHPNLARILDFGIWLNQPFMAMEYIDGAPLSKLISERVIPPVQAIDLFSQVLEGLAHAHEKGVLHRDIKPSNIMVRLDDGVNKAILLDFGIAKKIEPEDGVASTQALTRTGEMIGSPLYMSPEQARGEKLTEKSDLYSLGCSLFEALTGTPPFVGKTAVETFFLHMEQTPPTLKEAALGREFAPGLEKVVRKLLAKNPEDRFASADELRYALSLCLHQDREDTTRVAEKKKNSIVPILTAAAVLAAVSGAIFWFFPKSQKIEQQPIVIKDSAIFDLPKELDPAAEDDDKDIGPAGMKGPAPSGDSAVLIFDKAIIDESLEQLIVNDKNLVRLSINNSRCPKALLAKLPPSLRYLELRGAGLIGDDYKYIAKNANLKDLVLRFNMVSAKNLRDLAPLSKLQNLDLNSTHVDSEGLKELKGFKELKSLSVSDNETVDGKGLQAINLIKNLEYLDLSNTRVTSKDIPVLLKMPKLEKLAIKRIGLSDDGISNLDKFRHLTILRMAGNDLTSKAFAKLPVFPKLTELDVSDNRFDDGAINYFLKLKTLRDLHISRSLVTSDGVMRLASMPNLKELRIKKIRMSVEDITEFFKRSASCNAVYNSNNNSQKYTREQLLHGEGN